MGKGDKKSKRGKIAIGSFGVSRKRKLKKTAAVKAKKEAPKKEKAAKPKATKKAKAAEE